MSVFIFYYQT